MDNEKIINDLMKNERKTYFKQKKVKYFCEKYGIDVWECLSIYGEALERLNGVTNDG